MALMRRDDALITGTAFDAGAVEDGLDAPEEKLMGLPLMFDRQGIRLHQNDGRTDNGIVQLIFDHIAHPVKLRGAQFGRLQIALHMDIEQSLTGAARTLDVQIVDTLGQGITDAMDRRDGHDFFATGPSLNNFLGHFFHRLIGRSFTDHAPVDHLLDGSCKLLLVARRQIGRKLLVGHGQLPPRDRRAGNVHPKAKLIL